MKRDDILELQAAPAGTAALPVERMPLHFDGLFGWYHFAGALPHGDCVAVLCGPIGHEYTRAHRTMRHLADRLAARGVPALRFDYAGIGDADGSEVGDDCVQRWQESIRAAIAEARRLSGRQRVCLVGARLGAALAALATADTPVDSLVLWNPCVKGRAYVRELQAVAMTAARAPGDAGGGLESAGFTMSPATLDALRAIDLGAARLGVTGRVLIVSRDDLAADTALSDHIARAGIPCDTAQAPGWVGMMADHQFTVVPEQALDTIADWVAARIEGPLAGAATPPALPGARAGMEVPVDGGFSLMVDEEACRFGADRHLFGILSTPRAAAERPAIVMLNAGAIHHVGPNRLYVTLARQLAARGFPCLRMDLEGIGDSVRRTPGRENHPYPESAVEDTHAAVEYLRSRGYRRFLLLGLCSGAHAAYHTCLQREDEPVDEVILINPLVFYWSEGMSLETTRHFEDLVAYKRSMKDPQRWMKLVRGQVDLKRLAEVVAAHAAATLRASTKLAGEWLGIGKGTRLAQDMARVVAKRHITLMVAEGDPGRDILMHEARRVVRQASRAGRLRIEAIPEADHTFTQSRPRQDLVERILRHVTARYPCGAEPPVSGSTGPASMPS
jgi:alpha-beta hydrolase superfamily lysophospholipase